MKVAIMGMGFETALAACALQLHSKDVEIIMLEDDLVTNQKEINMNRYCELEPISYHDLLVFDTKPVEDIQSINIKKQKHEKIHFNTRITPNIRNRSFLQRRYVSTHRGK